jgi:hypothetical protein
MDEIDEAELTGAGRRGTVVDGAANGSRRTVQAALLRKCCHELRDTIDPRGLRMRNVTVAGSLDLTGLAVPFALRFKGCDFDTAPVVEGAQLFELALTGCPRLPGLLGNGVRLRRDLDLSRSRIAGAHWTNASTSKRSAIWLCESEIGGRLLLVDTTIDGQGDRAIQADRIRVGGSARLLHQFDARGEVRLLGARICGSLDLTGAWLSAVNGPAITIEGRLQFTGGSLTCPAPARYNQHGHAVEAISATVRGGIDLGWTAVSPSVDFTDTTTTFLADDPGTWPPRFIIAGLTYERFERPERTTPKPVWDQAARCAWLSRQAEFDSGPYEQAARVFQEHGYTSEAEQILMAQRKNARQVGRSGVNWPRRAIDAIYASIGYGYRPSRVLWALAVLLLLVVVSLELPASQATLRATNGNGDVYNTRGLLVSSAGPGGPARTRARPGPGGQLNHPRFLR